ncbi:MAG: hypothetical protein ABJE66_20665 [Deltaproteobacteria bacterium]
MLLLVMTVIAVALSMRKKGFQRTEGWILVAIYAVFVTTVLLG